MTTAPFLAVGELSPGQQAEADYASARVGWVIVGVVVVGALIWDAQRKVGMFRSNPYSDHDKVLLPQIDKKIEEGGGWARIRDLPGGKEYIWDLIERGVLEEDSEFVRRRKS